MKNNDELPAFIENYQRACRQFDLLKNSASQDNASARMAYNECRIALQDSKQSLDHFLQLLHSEDATKKEYYLHEAQQALIHFKELMREAEIKVKNARPMPPFLY